MTDTADTVPNWLAIIAIIISIIAMFTAWVRAGRANEISADDLQIAKDSLKAAKEANKESKSANEVSARSAAAAEASASEAKRSADIADRVAALQSERNNVDWSVPKKYAGGQWKATNTGEDTAYDAYVVLQVDGHRIVSEPGDLPGGHDIAVDISEITKAKAARNRASQDQLRAVGVAYFGSSTSSVKHQVIWRTVLGAWHVHNSEYSGYQPPNQTTQNQKAPIRAVSYEPGVHPDISNLDYHADPALRSSSHLHRIEGRTGRVDVRRFMRCATSGAETEIVCPSH